MCSEEKCKAIYMQFKHSHIIDGRDSIVFCISKYMLFIIIIMYYVYVTRKAKTDLMVLEIFDQPSQFNPLVHDDRLLHKFIILYLLCTMMQLPGNQVSSSSG